MSNKGTESASVTYNGVVSGRSLVFFSDGSHYFSMNSALGLFTGYNNNSIVKCETRCSSTGVLTTFNNYIQVGARGVSVQGDIYLRKTLSSKKIIHADANFYVNKLVVNGVIC